jgi:hypothetical protein
MTFLNRLARRKVPDTRMDLLVPLRVAIASLTNSEYMLVLIESPLGNSYVNFGYSLGFKAICRVYFDDFGPAVQIEVNVVGIHNTHKSSNS